MKPSPTQESVGNAAVPNRYDGLKAVPYKFSEPQFDGDAASYPFHFLPYESLPGKYQDVRHRTPDTAKAQRLLGFEAGITLAEGLRETVEWHQDLRDADATAEA